jgi:riboflavin synthase
MFTGIVEETGIVERIRPKANAIQLTVRVRKSARGLKIGDSLAVNGCCLTVTAVTSRLGSKSIRLDLLQETWTRTNLQNLEPGGRVNLERALKVGARLDGHFVTGHIDGTGKITRWEWAGPDRVLEISASPELMRYLVFKGSIAVDGISLTVALVRKGSFRVWIIPHTFEVTALREREKGDAVNLETDILAKYVHRSVTSSRRD